MHSFLTTVCHRNDQLTKINLQTLLLREENKKDLARNAGLESGRECFTGDMESLFDKWEELNHAMQEKISGVNRSAR